MIDSFVYKKDAERRRKLLGKIAVGTFPGVGNAEIMYIRTFMATGEKNIYRHITFPFSGLFLLCQQANPVGCFIFPCMPR